ncbi:MAG: hypothetical protein KC421_21010, partial [Anaerolineales bacterium]|nr:hypothetical protein [Anaerolineales bacterium]
MKTNMQLGSNNALIRRVRQYAQAAAIFRAADRDQGSDPPLNANPSSQPVHAYWQTAPTSLPVGQAIARAEMKPAPTSSSAPSLPASPLPTPPAASDPIPAWTPAVSRGPEPIAAPPSTPMVQTAPAKQEDDANWRRLQRIISMHEARTTDETTPTPSYTGGLGAIVAPSETVSPAAAAPIQHAIDAAESATPPPLESVWPVQRKSPTSPQLMTTSTSAAQMSTPPEPELPPAAPPDPATAETVRAKLNDVSAARRTDSSVELHLPRRPRPAAIQAKKSPESANEIFWNRLRSTDTQSDNRTVPTEIGPLPADMWEILGEVPPVQPEGQVPAMPKMSDTASPPTPTAIQRAAAAAEASPKMPTQTPPARTDPPTAVSTAPLVPPAAIQRAIAAAETASAAPTQTIPTPTEPPTAVSPTPLVPSVAVQRAIAAA